MARLQLLGKSVSTLPEEYSGSFFCSALFSVDFKLSLPATRWAIYQISPHQQGQEVLPKVLPCLWNSLPA